MDYLERSKGVLGSRPLRIGIDARLWNETGVGRYIRNLVTELQGIDTTNTYSIFVRKVDYPQVQQQITSERFHIVVADIQWHSIAEQIAFPQILHRHKLDLMHFPYFSVPMFYKGKYVVTIHDLIIDAFPTGKASTLPGAIYTAKRIGYKTVMYKTLVKAKKIITVSEATKQEIVKRYHVLPEKIAVTYEGVEKKKKETITPSIVLPQQYFLYVGNVYPHKNVERLVDAIASLHEKFPETKLVIVGKEDYFQKKLKTYVQRKQLEKTVLFTGFISDDDLARAYTHALGCVVPSLMEGFGLPALESMAYNCIPIVSDIPVLREVCRDAALYIDPYDVEAIARVLSEVVANKWKYKGVQERGQKRIKQFSWKEMAKQTQSLYEEILQ